MCYILMRNTEHSNILSDDKRLVETTSFRAAIPIQAQRQILGWRRFFSAAPR